MKPSAWRSLFVFTLALVLSHAADARAELSLRLVTNLPRALYVTHAGDARLFVVQQSGQIRIVDRTTGAVTSTPFLDISGSISATGERGLLSMAFHPDYASNGFFFVDYTNPSGDTVIARYRVSSDPNVAQASSGVTLMTIPRPEAFHNGGQLQVGPDGYLYIGMGDGGDACNAQDEASLLGKMLRLDVRANLNTPPYYGIPTTNPFRAATDPQGLIPDEVWAFGMRNPWRFSFDRANGDLHIADVGEELWEEVHIQRAGTAGGRNLGWPVMEGAHCYTDQGCAGDAPACNDAALTRPAYEYTHDATHCSITGGYVYRGSRAPELVGRYVFADFCGGVLEALTQVGSSFQSQRYMRVNQGGVTSFGEDASGSLYVIAGGNLYEVMGTGTPAAVPALGRYSPALAAACMLALGALLARQRARRVCEPATSERDAHVSM